MNVDLDRVEKVIKRQHRAIDALMARLIVSDPTFRPTQSGVIWDVVEEGNQLIQDIDAELNRPPKQT